LIALSALFVSVSIKFFLLEKHFIEGLVFFVVAVFVGFLILRTKWRP